MKLVENAKQAWRWFSVQAMALATAIQATWAMLDTDMRAVVPYNEVVVPSLTGVLLVLGIVGRLYKQDLPSNQEDGHIDLIKTPITKSFPSDK